MTRGAPLRERRAPCSKDPTARFSHPAFAVIGKRPLDNLLVHANRPRGLRNALLDGHALHTEEHLGLAVRFSHLYLRLHGPRLEYVVVDARRLVVHVLRYRQHVLLLSIAAYLTLLAV